MAVLVSSAQLLRRYDPEKRTIIPEITRQMASDIFTYHYKADKECVLETVLFPTALDNPAGLPGRNPGHSIENSWFLMNEAPYSGDQTLRKALNILNWSLRRGWDSENGGIYYFVDVNGRPCEQLEWDRSSGGFTMRL